MNLVQRLKHAYNAFQAENSITTQYPVDIGPGYANRPDRVTLSRGNERSIAAPLYTRIAIDVAAVAMNHVRVDQNGRYVETLDTGLNNCLSLEANIDQSGRSFIQDVVLSMFDEGAVAIVPVDTTINPSISGSYDVVSMRTGKILEWYPNSVRVNVYNDRTGQKRDILLPKRSTAIVENPLYSVMNERNSTLQRLITKLGLLDTIDLQSSSGKLDLIIQLPFVVKTEARRQQAELRRRAIEEQLKGSKYGIAYTDGTEKITQLNRPAENNLMTQVEYLTDMLYGQLGLTTSIFDGTADEKTMINYYGRTIEPILSAIADSMKRTFLTKTGRTQGQSIMFFRNPFSLVPTSELAVTADTFTRNAILSANDFRAIIGYPPDSNPESDRLKNNNLNPSKSVPQPDPINLAGSIT